MAWIGWVERFIGRSSSSSSFSDLYFGAHCLLDWDARGSEMGGIHDYTLFIFFRENGKDVQSRGRAVNVRCVYMYRNGLWID